MPALLTAALLCAASWTAAQEGLRRELIAAVADCQRALGQGKSPSLNADWKALAGMRLEARTAPNAASLEALRSRFERWHGGFCAGRRLSAGVSRNPALVRAQAEVFGLARRLPRRELSADSLDRFYDNGSGRGSAADFLPAEASAASLRPVSYSGAPEPPQGSLAAPAPLPVRLRPGLIDKVESWKLVQTIEAGARGFFGHCYAAVLQALQNSGVISWFRADPRETHAAYQFDRFVQDHPALHDRRFVQIDPRQNSLPIGGILVWKPGQCGFSPRYGHIEIVVSDRPPQACSDGCEPVDLSCLDETARSGGVSLYVIARPASADPTLSAAARRSRSEFGTSY